MRTAETSEPGDALTLEFARSRGDLKGPDGLTYREFRSRLQPNLLRIWSQLIAGYVVTAGLAGLAWSISPLSCLMIAIYATVFGVLMGYALHYLSLFQHAAGHQNLAKSKKTNDLAALILFGFWFGIHIRQYRYTHMEHHRLLGQGGDPENAYTEDLNWRFFLRSILGLRLLDKLRPSRKKNGGRLEAIRTGWVRWVGIALQLVVLSLSLYCEAYVFTLAWALAWGVVFPMLSDLRVLLEHRQGMENDFTSLSATSRLFRSGVISATFGAAGFQHHLLHHLEPAISYDCLKKLDEFLRGTHFNAKLSRQTTTYLTVFGELWKGK